MILNRAIKEQFISQIKNQIKNALPEEQHIKSIQDAAESGLPKDMILFIKNNLNHIRGLTEQEISDFDGRWRRNIIRRQYAATMPDEMKETQEHHNKLEEAVKSYNKIINAWLTKHEGQDELLDRIRQIVYACTTVKQLQDILPEFKQFLPQEEVSVEQLPVVKVSGEK